MRSKAHSIAATGWIALLIALGSLDEAAAEEGDGGAVTVRPDGGEADGGSPAAAVMGRARAEDGGMPRMGADAGGESALALAGHIVVEREGDRLRVMEMYVLMVGETIPPSDGEPWIVLPEGAEELEVGQEDGTLTAAPGGFALTEALERGRRPIAFSFEVPAPGGRATLAHSLPFSVEGLHLVWAADAPRSARAMGFQDTGTVDVRGRSMRVLERTAPIALGERLAIVTSGSMSAAPARRPHGEPTSEDPLGRLRFATIALAAVIVVAGLLLPWRRRLRARPRAGGKKD